MLFRTPALAVQQVKVVRALFKPQLPDTLRAVRQSIPSWSAAHVIAGPPGRGASDEEIRDTILNELKPLVRLHSPIYRLTTPEIPEGTVATFVPDQVKPRAASQYQDWKYVYYPDAREVLDQFLDKAVGGMPEGNVGMADALIKGDIRGQVGLEGGSASVGAPSYRRTMEAIVDPSATVLYWDESFGYEAPASVFLSQSELIVDMFGARTDRLYLDATNLAWFVCFYPGGHMRVGMLD